MLSKTSCIAVLSAVALVCSHAQTSDPQTAQPRVWPGSLTSTQKPAEQKSQAPAAAPSAPASAAPANSSSAGARKLASDLQVSGDHQWVDTGIDVVAGDKVSVISDGAIQYLGQSATPDGLIRTWKDVMRSLPVNGAGPGALIGRIGNEDATVPFLIGAKKEFTVPRSGRLFLGVNQGAQETGNGAFKVKLNITPTAQNAGAKPASFDFKSSVLDNLPRRVADQAGNAGDMVNFLIIGPEDKMKAAFDSAGWVAVDKTKAEAVLHAVLNTYTKKSYTEMPMSELYLFGRSQDYGFARAEPIQVVQTRHHLRVWKADFQVDGQDVWVGAATHDLGFEKDQRNNGITHKIDPNVDAEREFVAQCFAETGMLSGSTYTLPKNPVQDAKTATGGSFHSDGRVLVLKLK